MGAFGRSGRLRVRRRLAIAVGVLAAIVLTVVVLGETTGRRTGWAYVWGSVATNENRPSRVLLDEDFSSPSSTWATRVTDAAEYGWDDGAYRIAASTAEQLQYHTAPLDPPATAIRIEIEVVQRTGDANDPVGVICGGPPTEGARSVGYLVGVSPRGTVAVLAYAGSGANLEFGDAPLASAETSALHGLGRANVLRVECAATNDGLDAVTLFVNGERVVAADTEAGPVRFDHVGLFAGNTAGKATDARFDDLIVSAINPET